MIRAAAAPDRFLTRGYARFISRSQAVHPRAPARVSSFAVELPLDLVQLLVLTDGRTLGDFVPRVGIALSPGNTFAALLTTAARTALARATLCALLAGTVPF